MSLDDEIKSLQQYRQAIEQEYDVNSPNNSPLDKASQTLQVNAPAAAEVLVALCKTSSDPKIQLTASKAILDYTIKAAGHGDSIEKLFKSLAFTD